VGVRGILELGKEWLMQKESFWIGAVIIAAGIILIFWILFSEGLF